MTSRRASKKRKSSASRLSEHRKIGGTYKPPLMQIEQLRLVDWIPDILPDLLWVAGFIAHADDADRAMKRITTALTLIVEHTKSAPGGVIDGHLTSLDRVREEDRAHVVERLIDAGLYSEVASESWYHAIACYPDAPGAWLVETYAARGVAHDRDRGLAYLRFTLEACTDGQTRVATNAKAAILAANVSSGTVHFGPNAVSFIDELVRYPDGMEEDERLAVDSSIRAAYGAMRDLQPQIGDDLERAIEWARTFWRSNWTLTACERAGEDLAEDALDEPPPSEEEAASFRSAIKSASEAAAELHDRFLHAATSADPDLYDPGRHEVLTGITGRTLREIVQLLRTPVPWTPHGQHLVRVAVEALLLTRFIAMGDGAVLACRFKAYGRGKLKLLKLRWEEHLESLDDPPDELVEFVEALAAEVNVDVREEFQDIDFASNPLGLGLRKLAEAVGMTEDYDLVLAPASNALHGDWTTLDRMALERCLNPMHRWHRIPRLDLGWTIAPNLVGQLLHYAEELLDAFECAIVETTPRDSGSDS
jgi:hypothetical protein